MTTTPESPGERVVLVEDDAVTRMLVVDALERENYVVSAYETGEAALDAIPDLEPSVVLLDVILPGIDGFATCKRLRTNVGTAHTPILLMTGLDDVASVNAGFAAGATDFITKPINLPLLVQRLRFVLRTSSAAQALRRSRRRLAKAQRLARVSYWEYDLDTRAVELSPEIQQAFSAPEGKIPIDELGPYLKQLQVQELIEAGRSAIAADKPLVYEQTLTFGNKQEARVILHHAEVVEDEGSRRLLGTSQDITERKQAEEKIETLANFDSLTSLPNRRFLRRHLAQALASIELDNGGALAIMALDLDLFKRVNDSLGYIVGDKLLVAVAKRLTEVVRSGGSKRLSFDRDTDLVARVSGDEFVIVFHNLEGRRDAEVAAERVLGSFDAPFTLGKESSLFVSASVGVLVAPDDGTDVDMLLKCLDAALRSAKEKGRNNWQFYRHIGTSQAGYPVALSSELRRALSANELHLVYQPKFNDQKQLIGVEALCRWTHCDIGPISPATFIPIAEESGQVIVLGNWVIDSACRQIRQWLDSGFECPPVAVNVAARHCVAEGLLAKIQESLGRYRVPTHLFQIELTESALLESRTKAIERLGSLRAAGIKVALDDFGTGYSSLSYLKGLPLDQIKIDRSFIEDITRDAESAKIVDAIISLCHTLGLSVVAEGVETLCQFDLLKRFDCDHFQGFALAKPLEPEALQSTVLSRVTRHEKTHS